MVDIVYYDGGDSGKQQRVQDVLCQFPVQVRYLKKEDLSQTIGTLFEGISQEETMEPDTAFLSDLMILRDLSDEQIQEISNALRLQNTHVERKAVLTKHNVTWTFAALLKEIEEEHAYFQTYDAIKQAIVQFQSMSEELYTPDSWLTYQNAIVKGYALLQERAEKAMLEQAWQMIDNATQALIKQ